MIQNPEVKADWVAALRSGEYAQGVGNLQFTMGADIPDEFCCWGVLCDLAVKAGVVGRRISSRGTVMFYPPDDPENYSTTLAPPVVLKWLGLEDSFGRVPMRPELVQYTYKEGGESPTQTSLVSLNDNKAPFSLIADIIEREL